MKIRSLTASLVVTSVLAQGACSSDKPLRCTDSITAGCSLECAQSIDAYCATAGGCHLTWEAVLTDPSLCPVPNPTLVNEVSSSILDCGSYHVLFTGGEGGEAIGYYDLTTGMLVAEILGGHSQPLLSCGGGPVDTAFAPPDCSRLTPVAPPLCSADAGTDGA
jgi:hypothetical protein